MGFTEDCTAPKLHLSTKELEALRLAREDFDFFDKPNNPYNEAKERSLWLLWEFGFEQESAKFKGFLNTTFRAQRNA
jgi:hypothetical protein